MPYPSTLVFNAGVCKYQGRYAMVFRNDFGRWGDPTFDGTNLGLAFSNDGVAWRVEPEPCIDLARAVSLVAEVYPDRNAEEELLRFYDPRLTVLEGRVAMCFAVDTVHGIRGGIAWTDDFAAWEVVHLTVPDNRNMVLFPERIGGDFVRLERPFNNYAGHPAMRPGALGMWTSRSSDLRRWGDSRLVLTPRDVGSSCDKLGPGAPPIATDRGWLCAIHVVHVDPARGKNGWEDRWTKTYDARMVLLDRDDPSRVIGVGRAPLLSPEASYETGAGLLDADQGFRHDVIFPGGLIAEDDGSVKLFYGAADTVECLAMAALDDLLVAIQPV
ncbi:MAG: glycoside hydrolase family 130 protein [Planctomycetota bacterium]